MRVYFVDGEMVREFDSKGERIKYNTKEAFRKIGEWAKEHKKEVSIITTIAAVTGIKIIGTKMYRKLNPTNAQIERDRIDHTYYDPSSGLHWDLKRRLTNLERSRVDEARRNGTPVYDILKAMKVLKK
nr:MAG TPA: hypothetical protein [Caudoviricetes sp.]